MIGPRCVPLLLSRASPTSATGGQRYVGRRAAGFPQLFVPERILALASRKKSPNPARRRQSRALTSPALRPVLLFMRRWTCVRQDAQRAGSGAGGRMYAPKTKSPIYDPQKRGTPGILRPAGSKTRSQQSGPQRNRAVDLEHIVGRPFVPDRPRARARSKRRFTPALACTYAATGLTDTQVAVGRYPGVSRTG